MAVPAGGNPVWVALIDALAPLVPVAAAAYVTWKIAVWRTRESVKGEKEKDIYVRTWELRRIGYSTVLEKLGLASKFADRLYDGFTGFGGEQFYPGPEWKKYNKKMWTAWAKCQSEFRKNRLFYSTPFISSFRDLERSLPNEHDYDQESEDRLATRHAKCFQNGYEALWQIARSEFGLNSEDEQARTKAAHA